MQREAAWMSMSEGSTGTRILSAWRVNSIKVCPVTAAGVFATTFRDYATSKLEDNRRFILVRAGETRILTCFLEYQEHQVMVHDLLHEKEHGRWRQAVSSYPKLRLAPAWLMVKLSALGFSVKRDTTPSGMVCIVATKN